MNKFDKFLNIIEVLYAVSLTWGLARLAEFFTLSLDYCLPALIAGFVLIRFFFAPSHNLYDIAIESTDHLFLQRIVFLFDIPIMIIHSFVYYRMCYSISLHNYTFFYILLFLLLLLNAAWLFTIDARNCIIAKRSCWKHRLWAINNALCAAIFFISYLLGQTLKLDIFSWNSIWPFSIAAFNCIFDLWKTAPYYLGYKE